MDTLPLRIKIDQKDMAMNIIMLIVIEIEAVFIGNTFYIVRLYFIKQFS